MHHRSISNADMVRQSGGYGARRRFSPSASNTSHPLRRRLLCRIRDTVLVNVSDAISRTTHATPTLSTKLREFWGWVMQEVVD